jgi:hypothetical protein
VEVKDEISQPKTSELQIWTEDSLNIIVLIGMSSTFAKFLEEAQATPFRLRNKHENLEGKGEASFDTPIMKKIVGAF